MDLEGMHIAMLAEDNYEELELWYPVYRLREAGASVVIVGSGRSPSFTGRYGYPVKPDKDIKDVMAANFDAVVIPGGYAPDLMRRSPEMVKFVRDMNSAGKAVAAICHAGWMLVSADIVTGRHATCFFSVKDDLVAAGALYEDASVVVDGNLITSRFPADLPHFCKAIIAKLAPASVSA